MFHIVIFFLVAVASYLISKCFIETFVVHVMVPVSSRSKNGINKGIINKYLVVKVQPKVKKFF